MKVSDLAMALKNVPEYKQLPIQFRLKGDFGWSQIYEIPAALFEPGENGLTVFAGDGYEPLTVGELLALLQDVPADGELCSVLVDDQGREMPFFDVALSQGNRVTGLIASP